MLEMLLFGYLITCVSGKNFLSSLPTFSKHKIAVYSGLLGQGRADVVLSCSLVEESSGVGEMGGGALFSLTSATLVLRDLAVDP